ncbi:DNA topoisomerase 4 subunit A [Candidatus Gracilibacteria bacterium]|nr:DNA topoisomerase 4 subunit A [Candidatus Gracilibacteria bacterium]
MSNQEELFTRHEKINHHPIEKEITQSYIDYAMSVIVARALPDTRDGFKPVLRRILYGMYENNNFYNQKHKKSARIVGDVMGKYHPHGDSSIYEAMVRLAQPWSMRYPLVDGQGNFGSIDGDGAAAMRYTEARLTKIAEEMLADLEQDTVDWRDNFDGSLKEPVMLATKFPNHLCNGTMGIAVGMATNMAPHNLNEVLDASLLLLQKEGKSDIIAYDESGAEIRKPYSVSIEEIMQIIKGPDFPTGGIIFDSNNILEVYKKGKGGIIVRGKTHEEIYEGAHVIVIDEIPYLVNKSSLVSKIGELVVDKKIEGINDIRDESNRDRIRIAIYLKKGVDPEAILMQIYKFTDLQTNFNLNNVSLIEKGTQPRLLNIKDLLMEFVTFRRDVVYRRSVFQLNKAKDRLHILEGLKKAIDIIDEVIDTIKHSESKNDARQNLMDKFGFSEKQAEYILLMRLQSLVGLEIQKISDEIDEKIKVIEYLEAIISDPEKLDQVVAEEFEYMKKKHGDERRTELSNDLSVYNISGSLKEFQKAADRLKEDVICWIGNDFSLRVLYQTRIQNIPDETLDLIYTHNQDQLVVITDQGELVVQRLKDFGQFTMAKQSLDIKQHFSLKGKIVFAKTLHFHYDYLVFLTNQNSIKKIKKELVLSFKKFPTTIMGLEKGEKILKVLPVSDGENIGVLSQQGRMLLFKSDEVRPMGKTAGGVKAIELQEGDQVANMFLHTDEPFILIYSDKNGKLLSLEDLKLRKRARKGQVVMTGNEKLEGGISIIEGAVRIRFSDGSLKTLHSNDISLDEPETPLYKMVDQKIDVVYRPREEKSENLKYKEEKKKAEKSEGGLFDMPVEEEKEENTETSENGQD